MIPSTKPFVSYSPVKISAERALARLELAEADMEKARQLDNTPADTRPEVGLVSLPGEGDGYYTRLFQGDTQQGSLMGDFTHCTFDGDRVTVHDNPRAYTGTEQWIYKINRSNLAESTAQNIVSGW